MAAFMAPALAPLTALTQIARLVEKAVEHAPGEGTEGAAAL
ncbi:hypothetical protein [Dankookia sp. P2]